jgi:hypothetical protein
VAALDADLPREGADATAGGLPLRGDDDVVHALTTYFPGSPSLDYLNLSFGSYGCSTFDVGDFEFRDDTFGDLLGEEGGLVFDYRQPLGMRMALTAVRNANGGEMHVFAAAGNDSFRQDEGDPEVFYPAGWALRDADWIHSVASDPKLAPRPGESETGDYSNRNQWVETQARGTFAVSWLPDTSWGPPDWYSWSGTSFATPCALAKHAASADWLHAAEIDAPTFADCGMTLPNEPP